MFTALPRPSCAGSVIRYHFPSCGLIFKRTRQATAACGPSRGMSQPDIFRRGSCFSRLFHDEKRIKIFGPTNRPAASLPPVPIHVPPPGFCKKSSTLKDPTDQAHDLDKRSISRRNRHTPAHNGHITAATVSTIKISSPRAATLPLLVFRSTCSRLPSNEYWTPSRRSPPIAG